MSAAENKRKEIKPGHLRFLQGVFPAEDCLTGAEETHVFGADASRLFHPPLAVVRPTTVEQVQELLAWAHAEKIPLYPRARATNVVGACVPKRPGIVVSTLKMNRVLEIDADDFAAVVEPGVVTAEFQSKVESAGLFYPPDPASVKISTLGGNVATCAGGMRAVKYGVTRDYVLGLEAVLPGGELINPGGRTHKNVVGLDFTRLLTGSEGTLAFVTKIILKLLPLPESSASIFLGYASAREALQAAGAVFRAGILPTAMEFLDATTMEALRRLRSVPWPEDTDAGLLIKVDGGEETLPLEMRRLEQALEGTGHTWVGKGVGAAEEEPLWELRRVLNPASFRIRPNKMGDDVTVPRGKLIQAVEGVHEIAARFDVPIMTFGHVGDGNLHVNAMHDNNDRDETRRATEAKAQVRALVLKLNGSLSGEHGVGLVKHPYVQHQLSNTERRLMQGVKRVFDPHNIMNPGKAF